MQDTDVEALVAAIATLEGQRATLGGNVFELAVAPLRARLAAMQRPAGLQRRQVTVLFADIVGSTAMASRLDAEDTLDVMSGALQRMATLVEAHQGRVLRFTGDGVKAAFGMDQAREDDPARAVRAGLAVLQAGQGQAQAALLSHGVAHFAVRVGVHTGAVTLGAGVEADNTAMGAAVNIAARMEQSAPPGALRISHDTFNHVRGLFEVEPQPPLQLKGIEAPMKTYLVRAALDRRAASVERGLQGLSTPMVGRGPALQRLQQATAHARQTRQLQALTLMGDAGLGKSRLLREWLAGLNGCRVLTVRSQPDGMLRPWGVLRGLLAAQCGVADTDSADVARRKAEEGLSPWFHERGQRQAQLIGQLSGLDFGNSPHVHGLDPCSLRDQALAAFRKYLQGLAQGDALLVLIVEDLHWSDDDSLDLLQHLLVHAAELPLVLVMTGRPTLLMRRPEWGTGGSIVQLSPLATAHCEELAQALLQRLDGVPQQLSQLLVGQAEGNPYYMEELVRRLIDDGVIEVGEPHWSVHVDRLDKVSLPGTLVGLLQARLDALPAGERRVARQASVIGHVFWDDALQALDADATQALPGLERAAFVREHETSGFEGTQERQFNHHLLHQVTYDTLLKGERRVGHSAAARWLFQRTRGRGAEFLAMTGEHAERAGETALAVDCFEQAGKECRIRFANAAAQSYFRRAMALLGESEPARRIDLADELERIADTVGDRDTQGALHREMAAIMQRHPDDLRQARLRFSLALLADRRSDTGASEQLSREAFALAERCKAARWAAMAQGQLAWLHIVRLDYLGAAGHVEIALQWAGQIEAESTRLETEGQMLTLSAMVSMLTSRLDEARETFMAVLSRGQTLGLPRLQIGALNNLAGCAARLGRWDEMADWAERTRVLAHTCGALPKLAYATMDLGRAAAALNDRETALRWLGQSLVSMHNAGDRRGESTVLGFLAGLHLDRGDAQAALQHCADAQALHQTLTEPIASCEIDGLAALCQTRLGQRDAALSSVDALLSRLGGDLSQRSAHETLDMRWHCQQVLEALADARATPLLVDLYADMQARAAKLTEAADRERLVGALPVFRGIAAAYREHGNPGAAR